jgi:hypothetical protein
MSLFRCLVRTKVSVQVRSFVCEYFVTKIRFYRVELLAPRPTTKLNNQPFSAVRNCLFNIFAAILPKIFTFRKIFEWFFGCLCMLCLILCYSCEVYSCIHLQPPLKKVNQPKALVAKEIVKL